MATNIKKSVLRKEINAILKDADLTTTSSKSVRLQLEKKLKVNLLERKKEIDDLVMEFVNPNENEENDNTDDGKKSNGQEESTGAETDEKPSDKEYSGRSDSDGDSADDLPKKRKAAAKAKKPRGRKRKNSDASDSDGETKKSKKKKSGKGNGYTKAYNLSPELAAIMGADSMPRQEVVKKMWSIIKERNLYDPKNKQFAICDAEIIKVIGVQRFRPFGMLKYLKKHFSA